MMYLDDLPNSQNFKTKTITFDAMMNHTQSISNLSENHSYIVRIAAATNEGLSPFSEPVAVTTLENSK